MTVPSTRVTATSNQSNQGKVPSRYVTTHGPLRVVTAASLFDGHDAAINLIRRLLQAAGVEVIHLGHNRSVDDIVRCALQEDAHAIAVSSYQGGHVEFFSYMHESLATRKANAIRIIGGGGGTMLPQEIKKLHDKGIERLYSANDGLNMGLEGMIDDMIARCDYPLDYANLEQHEKQLIIKSRDTMAIARLLSTAENKPKLYAQSGARIKVLSDQSHSQVIGITGTGGAGKSSVVDELLLRFLRDHPNEHIAVLSVDPSRQRSGGALLGDRIRMNAAFHPRVYMRSMATRTSHRALSDNVTTALEILRAAQFDWIILETAGIGQADTEIAQYADTLVYVMTPEYGAPSQLEKINMLDYADFVVLNKYDRSGSEDALRDIRKQYRRNHQRFQEPDDHLPVYATQAAQFNDEGLNVFYAALSAKLAGKPSTVRAIKPVHPFVIPPSRRRYLSEIAESVREYNALTQQESARARTAYALHKSMESLGEEADDAATKKTLKRAFDKAYKGLSKESQRLLEGWHALRARYEAEQNAYSVRNKEIVVDNYTTTLSNTRLPKVALPNYTDWGDLLRWLRQEHLPGYFPYTAGVFPYKRAEEDPTRMFAGEGSSERTNKRFHYLSKGLAYARLSTAFDSVTLYGEDPHVQPDIYGKIGNAGVSISTLDEMKKLYAGFDLCAPNTSVSMTINGPAATICAFFMNAAIDQQCERYLEEAGRLGDIEKARQTKYKDQKAPTYHGQLPSKSLLGSRMIGLTGDEVLAPSIYAKIKKDTLSRIRGTVQADILKEDQAQNTCIFSTEFSLRLMGDMQAYIVDNAIRNFYSVSISGYHIAEAGAFPITQLAFTLANGFTYVEYYLARGMKIDSFAPNLSFFFSNGLDAEYQVMGRVARRLWAKALACRYGANTKSQRLKYHIQTSGRSLHAQEISFNDIRTTLQALCAVQDQCNSLHTNAYDEAITTPTEESVRRALAIQLIINKELGLTKTENTLQGAFIIEQLTDRVEEAVLKEFERLSERGGVLGAMESMYQRGKIQDESMEYEHKKSSGDLPIMGVNTFLAPNAGEPEVPDEVIRSTDDEKKRQIHNLKAFHRHHSAKAKQHLSKLQKVALNNENTFSELMETVKYCSLGQITHALYEVGGAYRRNM